MSTKPTGRRAGCIWPFRQRTAPRSTAFTPPGLAAGGRDNGAPGERDYHPGYYAAFLLDPDGSNIEVVYHGPAARSAPFIEITPGG